MKIQVLVATMNQKDDSLIKKMNIQSDAIIGNQCGINSIDTYKDGKNDYLFLNFNEKGVGLNRNNALMRANGDICLFADDDIVYVDNYVDIVEKAYNENPKADVIIFNIKEDPNSNSNRFIIRKKTNVNYFNFLRYGAVRITARLKSIRENAIYFNQCFGGGCIYRHGEDNLFLAECLKKKLKVIALPIYISELKEERPSTWNVGYDDKYFSDQGKLYFTLSRKWWKFLCLQDAIRHSKIYNKKWYKVYKMMKLWKKNENIANM